MTLRDSFRNLVRIPAAWLLRRTIQPGAWDNPSDPTWGIVRGSFPTNYTRTGRTARMIGWESHATVQACCRVLAEGTAAVPLEAYTKGPDGSPSVLPITNPLQQLLDQPRVGITKYRLTAITVTHYKLYGNAYWIIERKNKNPNGVPAALRLVHPEWVQYVFLDRETLEPALYEWRDRWGDHHTTLASDVIHFRDLSAGEWIFGYPAAAAVIYEMATEREASEYVRQLLMNDGTPGNVALTMDGSTAQDAKNAERMWYERMSERGGRGAVRFLTGVKDFKPIGFTLKDLEFPDLRSINRESICSAFNVDPRLVGATSAKGLEGGLSQASYSEARRRLYSQAIIPTMRDLEATLSQELGAEFGFVYIRFNPEAIADLTETEQERATRLAGLLQAGMITREESRRGIRFPEQMVPTDTLVAQQGRLEYPVASAGDRLAASIRPPTPFAFLPAGSGAGNADAAGNVGAADAAAEEGGGKGKAKGNTGSALNDASTGGDTLAAERHLRALKRGTMLSPEARKAAWTAFDGKATDYEPAYRQAALELFAGEREDIGQLLDHAVKLASGRSLRDDPGGPTDPYILAALKRIQADYAPGGKYHELWLKRYKALIGETMTTSAGQLAAALGADFNLQSPRFLDAISARAAALADNVTDYSASLISDLIGDAGTAGMGIADTANLLMTSLAGMDAARATRIARTETVGALNQGDFMAAKDSGVMASKEWLTMEDDKVRDSHVPLDGMNIALSDVFPNGCAFPGDGAGGADEVINCRCTLLYYGA
jgi:HK97 family phage portal protein